jgi:MoxR-like ATPase
LVGTPRERQEERDEMTNENTTNGKGSKLTALAGLLLTIRTWLCAAFLEREQAIDAMLTAAVAGEHVLMVGLPGTGKSAIAKAFAEIIGGRSFEHLFGKFTTPEDFVGPFSIAGLNADKYVRVIDGGLADSEVAFLDEIFKSNTAALNFLLPILNERVLHQGGKAMPVPLRVAVAASNELPNDEALGALWDRIMLRLFVEPCSSDKSREAITFNEVPDPGPMPTLPMAMLDVDLRDVAFPAPVRAVFGMIRHELEAKDRIIYGDRRWKKAARLVRAYALVCGDTVVDSRHLAILTHVLWDKPEQRERVAEMIRQVAQPHLQAARGLLDALITELPDRALSDLEMEELTDNRPKVKTCWAFVQKKGIAAGPGREQEEIRSILVHLSQLHKSYGNEIKRRTPQTHENELDDAGF